jgi:hypothetical protein
VTVSWLQMTWLHEISQSALAAAVLTLGLVILLELRSIRLLRRSMDSHLGRVFEQLDLLRFEHPPIEAGSQSPPRAQSSRPVLAAVPAAANPNPPPALTGNAYAAAAALASTGMKPEEIAQRCGLAAGEARLLASLATARAGRQARA